MNNNTYLLERLKMGDEKAGDELVEKNMGLVYSIVNKFSNKRYENEDLIQIGAIGLIKAVRKFDISYGVQFSTYAVPMIIGEIKRFMRDDGAIKVSRSIKENSIKGRKAEEVLRKRLGRNPTIKEISAETGIDEEQLITAFDAPIDLESLQAGMSSDSDDKNRALIETVASDDTEEKIIDRVFIEESLSGLSERERNILLMRYFRGKTQAEIADKIGVSQVQVSRIEKKALQKIRDKMLN